MISFSPNCHGQGCGFRDCPACNMARTDKPTTIKTVGSFIEYCDNVTGQKPRQHLLHWNEIAEVTEGDDCCLIRMRGTQTDFYANVDYKALRTWLWEKIEDEKV